MVKNKKIFGIGVECPPHGKDILVGMTGIKRGCLSLYWDSLL